MVLMLHHLLWYNENTAIYYVLLLFITEMMQSLPTAYLKALAYHTAFPLVFALAAAC